MAIIWSSLKIPKVGIYFRDDGTCFSTLHFKICMPGSNHSFKRTLQREICLVRKELSLVQRVLCSRRVLKVFFWSYCVWVYVCVYMHVPARRHSFTWWSDNNGSWFVYLVGPGDQTQIIRLGSKCLYPPRAILPSRCWVFDMTLLMKIVITTAVLPALLENDAIFLKRMFK